MASSDIDVCSQALVLLGSEPISSFTEDSDAAEVCAKLYPDFARALLAERAWKFTRAIQQLSREVTAPDVGWLYAFTLPPDRMSLPIAYANRAGTDARRVLAFDIVGGKVMTDEEVLWATYVRRPPETEWPPAFTQVVITGFAAHIATSITDQIGLQDRFYQRAFGTPADNRCGGLMAAAITEDTMGSPVRSIFDNGDPITEARFGDGASYSLALWGYR